MLPVGTSPATSCLHLASRRVGAQCAFAMFEPRHGQPSRLPLAEPGVLPEIASDAIQAVEDALLHDLQLLRGSVGRNLQTAIF